MQNDQKQYITYGITNDPIHPITHDELVEMIELNMEPDDYRGVLKLGIHQSWCMDTMEGWWTIIRIK